MIIDLNPVDRPDRRDGDLAAPVSEFLVAVFVIEARVPPPGRLQGGGERRRGGSLDERGADILAVGGGRIELLVDRGQQAAPGQDDLHFLVREPLDVVDREDDVRPAPAIRRPRGQQRLLDADRMHGVPVDQQDPLAEVLAGQPQRVGVVPFQRAVIVDQLQRDPIAALQARGPVGDDRGRVPDHDDDLGEPHRSQVAQRDVQDGGLACYREQRLGQLISLRTEPSGGSRRQDHADQRLTPLRDVMTFEQMSTPRYAVSAA